MKLKLWQVDAFAERPFSGNPAAIVPLEQWLPDATMQAIANENNLSETAFFVRLERDCYALRWFTPAAEIPLCGHATLASGWVVLNELSPSSSAVRFETKSGELTVARGDGGRLRMSLPADEVEPFPASDGFGEALGTALNVPPPDEIHVGRKLMAVWKDAAIIREIKLGDIAPVIDRAGRWGLIVTAGGPTATPYDFISRFFSVGYGIPEDPVTGAAHCALTPFWAKRLGKTQLRAYQASPRGGDLLCTDEGARVILAGPCALYMRGEIEF
ncbi:MAG TPA: PhzF family phenazine biosynthesis protein [Micropepsaceae bacterium]|nr:PhzF family phenazine biosynthesis protein [Micropepsaceae bacterium]